MIHIRHAGVARVPIDVAFAYLDNYENVPKWMFGISQFTPTSEFTQGLGATFDTVMQIGPKTLRSRVEITEWVENDVITISSLDGIANSSTWRFTAKDEEHTELNVDFAYSLPGGLAGRALGHLIEPIIDTAITGTENKLRRNLEQL